MNGHLFKYYFYLVRNGKRSKDLYSTDWVSKAWHELERKTDTKVLLIRSERRER